MDIKIEKKKGIRKKHIPYIAGCIALLLIIIWAIWGNHNSKLNVDVDRISIQIGRASCRERV